MTQFDDAFTMTIDGKAVSSHATLDAINPATEDVIANFPDATREQLEEAVSAAQAAFPSWSRLPVSERQQMVREFGRAIEANGEALMSLLTTEQGKARDGAEFEVGGSAAWCRGRVHCRPACYSPALGAPAAQHCCPARRYLRAGGHRTASVAA